MLVKALEEYIKNCSKYTQAEYDIYISNISYKSAAFFSFIKKPLVRIIIDLKNTTVPWEAMIKNVQVHLAQEKGTSLTCLWYVCSSHGGIYLYETFATKETKKIGMLRNLFIIFNTDNGTVSFGPGHKYNNSFSQRLGSMLASSRFFTREKWLQHMFDIFALCDSIRMKGGTL